MVTAMLSAEERQQRLNEAAARYMRDEIGEEAYEDAKRQFTPDYRASLLALGARLTEPTNTAHEAPATEKSGPAELLTFLVAIFVVLVLLAFHRDRLAQNEPHQEAA